ncbi:MAG: hypothetical protein IPM79_36895 [Polyangiaceae bacterium]|nr:hypothetical protein [Polyangiaceae bacterium]
MAPSPDGRLDVPHLPVRGRDGAGPRRRADRPLVLRSGGRPHLRPRRRRPFGRGFALAWVEAIDPSAPTVFVRVFDEDGTLRAEGAYDTSPAFLVPSRISLVSSPNEDALIVAWEAADEERRVVAARFACVQAL